MDRRTLLRWAASAPLAFSPLAAWAAATPGQSQTPRRLLLIELNGGNDSLAMVTPYADPQLQQLRGRLVAPVDQLVRLDERIALNPGLEPLKAAFDDRELAVVMGLGYADSSRSHFKSIAIWDAARETPGPEGWLAPAAPKDDQAAGYAAEAVVIGRNPAPVSGRKADPIVMSTAQNFVRSARDVAAIEAQSDNRALQRLLQLQDDIETAAHTLTSKLPPAPGEFPKNPLGRDIAQAAQLLAQPTPVAPVVKIAQTGYDTHVNQLPRHNQLMTQLGESLAALRTSLTQAGVWDHTLVMTYSEFGRRAKVNGNGGTDHGTSASHFVMGGAIKGGLIGEVPSLTGLEGDDLRVTTDFRCLYNAVLADWLGRPELQIEPDRHRKLALI